LNSWGQFYQHFTCTFYACRSQKRKKDWQLDYIKFALLESACVKAARRTLMKLIPGVNFINILRSCFMYKSELSSFSLVMFGFEIFWRQNIGKKVTRKMLMKLTPGIWDVELEEEEAVKISRLKRIAFYTFRAQIGTRYLLRKNKLHIIIFWKIKFKWQTSSSKISWTWASGVVPMIILNFIFSNFVIRSKF
jgi:hypothetical protein